MNIKDLKKLKINELYKIAKELNVEVAIFDEDDASRYDPASRAKLAKPYRPAIYFE